MSWNTSVVTNAGVGLLNESLAGHTLTIESAVGGAGTQTEDEIKVATDVAEPKQTLKLTGIEDFEDGKRVGIQITNEGISESYILHQIGVKAHLEYEEEDLTLLFVLQDERGVEIPTAAENPDFLFEVYAVITISNDANIVVNVSTGVTASVTYVDEKVESEISEHSADKNAHQDIRDLASTAKSTADNAASAAASAQEAASAAQAAVEAFSEGFVVIGGTKPETGPVLWFNDGSGQTE